MGIKLISKIEPKNDGTFPMLEDVHLEGGFQIRDNTTDRDSIPTLNRKEGMLVYVIDSGLTYRLGSGLTDSDWEVVGFEGLGYKNPVRLATTSNISSLTSGAPSTVDGTSVSAGDRILVHQQTDQSENGIYTVTTVGTGSNGVWARSSDANTSGKILPGLETYVVEGSTYATTKFWLTTAGPITLDTTNLVFTGGLTVMTSDSSPTTVLSSTAIGGNFAAATATDSISVRGFREIDYSFLIASGGLGDGPITEIRMRILYSVLASPDTYATAPEDWNILAAEEIAAGVSTVDPYTLSFTVASHPTLSSLPGSIAFRAPVSGLHMMVLIWAEAGTATNSDFVGYALRRVQ